MKKIIMWGTIPFLLAGCYNREITYKEIVHTEIKIKEKSINYRDISVPEEGGMKFIRFTQEDEYISGPTVTKNKGVISWFASNLIAIDPKGDKIAYIGEKDEKRNIYIKNVKGGRTTIQRTFREDVHGVSFSRDGANISFVDKLDKDLNVYQINATEGAAVQQITNTESYETSPAYSADGSQIFYSKAEYSSSQDLMRYYIWSYDLSTALSTQYSEGFSPCLDKNDNLMYVTRNDKETGLGEIWSINLKTGQEMRILDDREKGFSTPQVSPDGKKLLITGSTLASSKRIENLDMYMVNTDGTGLTQMTFHPGNDVSAIWGPKGEKIFFLSQRGNAAGNFGVWMIEYTNN
jgi:Tol biopolymer transport system component